MSESESIIRLVNSVFCRTTNGIALPESSDGSAVPSAGTAFEHEFVEYMQGIARAYHGVVFHNLYIPFENGDTTAQVDCIVLLPDRLVIAECKDCSGTVDCESIIAENGKPYWKQVTVSGQEQWLYSPVAQNMSHVRAVNKYTGVPYTKCFSLIVFSNHVQLLHQPDMTGSQAILKLSEVRRLNLQPIPAKIFSPYRFNSLLEHLDACKTPGQKVVELHAQRVRIATRGKPKARAPSVCPYCGSRLQERHGYTTFLGCSMWPMCEYTYGLESDKS